jgi:hypothetical protein
MLPKKKKKEKKKGGFLMLPCPPPSFSMHNFLSLFLVFFEIKKKSVAIGRPSSY